MAGKPDGRVTYILDEVQNAGTIPILRTALAEYNGYGLQFVLILQDFDKMIMNYTREGLQSMIQNCDVICCFGGDPILAERVRRMAGKESLWVETPSLSEAYPGALPRVSYSLLRAEPELVRASHIRRTARDGSRAIIMYGAVAIWAARRPIHKMPWLHARWKPNPMERHHRKPGPLRRAWYTFTDGFSRAVEAREDPNKI